MGKKTDFIVANQFQKHFYYYLLKNLQCTIKNEKQPRGRAMENTDYTTSKIKICLRQMMLTSLRQAPLEYIFKPHPEKHIEPEVLLKIYSFQGVQKQNKPKKTQTFTFGRACQLGHYIDVMERF